MQGSVSIERHKHRDQFKALAIIVAALLVVAEVLFLSQSFDAYQLVQGREGLGWRTVFGYFGQLAKLLTVFCFLTGLAIFSRFTYYWARLNQLFSWRRYVICALGQLCLYVCIYKVSEGIFNTEELAELTNGLLFSWLLLIFFWLLLSLLVFTSLAALSRFIGIEGKLLTLVFSLAIAVWWLASLSTSFWGPLSAYTFYLAALVLKLFASTSAEVYVDPQAKDLGLSDFVVNIAPACSGYEGIGLVCSFIALYLYIHKHEFKFPQALLLFPIGAIVIWLFNVVRIVVLILIGQHWSAEVAVGGFHSQAGWMTFIISSLGILWAASSLSFFSKDQDTVSSTKSIAISKTSEDVDLAIATLIPMVVLLTVILVTSAVSAGFDWLYPLRVIAVCGALVWAWPKFALKVELGHLVPILLARKSVESLAIGLFVAVLWTGLLFGKGLEQNKIISDGLASQSAGLAALWLLFRFVGSSITVPIAEELAFRAYMLCKLSSVPVSLNTKLPISALAVAASSLAFGFLHGAWLAGTIAGVLYAFIRYRCGHVGYAILAHGFTNALLFGTAIATGEWSLL